MSPAGDQTSLHELLNVPREAQVRFRESDSARERRVKAMEVTSVGANNERDLWASVNAFNPDTAKNTRQDVVQVHAISVDLDLVTERKARALPTVDAVWEVIRYLAALLGVGPRVVVATGGGFHAHFATADHGEVGRWGQVHRAVVHAAVRYADARGWSIDKAAYGVERVWRIPGTYNHKSSGPVTLVDVQPNSTPLRVDDAEVQLERWLSPVPAQGVAATVRQAVPEEHQAAFEAACHAEAVVMLKRALERFHSVADLEEGQTTDEGLSWESNTIASVWLTAAEIANSGWSGFDLDEVLSVISQQRWTSPAIAFLQEKTAAEARRGRTRGCPLVYRPSGAKADIDDLVVGVRDWEPEAMLNLAGGRLPAGWHTLETMAHLPNVKELWAGHLPARGLALLSAPGSSYKTFLACGLATALVTGRKSYLGHALPGTDVGVLWVAAEGFNGLLQRFEASAKALAANLDEDATKRLHIFDGFVDLYTPDEGLETLLAMCRHYRPGLIVVDTLSKSSGVAEENNNTHARMLLKSMKLIEEASGGLVLALAHSGRATSYTTRGASAMTDGVDAVVHIVRDGGDSSGKPRPSTATVAIGKALRDGVPVASYPVYAASTGDSLALYPGNPSKPLDREREGGDTAYHAKINAVVDLLAEAGAKGATYKEICAALNYKRSTLVRYMKTLRERSQVTCREGEGLEVTFFLVTT